MLFQSEARKSTKASTTRKHNDVEMKSQSVVFRICIILVWMMNYKSLFINLLDHVQDTNDFLRTIELLRLDALLNLVMDSNVIDRANHLDAQSL